MSAPLLHVDNLVKCFGGLAATDRATLQVQRGEIHALIGPNGAGKTTLIHQISGALAPDEGRIVFDGADLTHTAMHQRARLGLVRSYQITSVFTRLTVQDNLALAIQAGKSQAVETSFKFWQAARSEHTRYARAAEVAERVGLQAQLMQPAGALSHGEQRQLEVGLALATSPKLMLLDEPMAGMGPDESERMVQLLQSLRGDTTLLLVEHDMDAVFRLADTISVLVSGQIIACGTAEQIKNDAAVKRAYLGDE
jgi:branched-chain amino acid transport system ATP-binding protein